MFAKQGNPHRFKFTVPLQRHIDCNFSYAGLKNSVRLAIEAEAPGPATDANLQVFPCCTCTERVPHSPHKLPQAVEGAIGAVHMLDA